MRWDGVRRTGRTMVVLGFIASSCSRGTPGRGEGETDGAPPRYRELATLIKRNRHFSAHFVMAVDARTIKAVRQQLDDRDLPVLIRMLSDPDDQLASSAAALLTTMGMTAVPPLRAATEDPVAGRHARHALETLQACYDDERSQPVNPDLCPEDRDAHRGERLDLESR